MKTNTYAGIDIGSNAIRLLISDVAEYEKETEFNKTVFIRVPIRLGEDVFSTGKIGKTKKAELTDAMNGFHYIMKVFNIKDFRAYATSAMREASNGDEICEAIMRETGMKIDIISGDKEAEIIFNSGMKEALGIDRNYLYVDVGGGSTEITVYSDHKMVDSRSFPIGTVRILQDAVGKHVLKDMKKWLKYITSNYEPTDIIGSGGNINKTIKMLNKKDKEPIDYRELKLLYEYIKSFSFEQRIEKLKLNPYRADVIIPAQKIFLTIMKTSNIDNVYVPKMGLVDGIVRSLYNEYK